MRIKTILIIICLFFSGFLTNFLYAQENSNSTKRVLILPFKIYAQQDYSYLKEAIPQMLSSRLFTPSKVEIIDIDKIKDEIKKYPEINQDVAKNLAQKFKADYVIWGSITILGKAVSIDAQIMDFSGNKKPVKFFQEIKDLSEIIPQISRFAWKAKMYIEGKEKDFYKAEPFYAMTPYASDKIHPEREFYYYAPYLYPPVSYKSKPKVTKAKPAFGDTLEEGLTKNLVIDLSKGTIGWAEGEEKNKKTSQENSTMLKPSYPLIYPPQPYYSYSPPPYYYYQQEEKEGFFSKLWPFGKKKKQYQTQIVQFNSKEQIIQQKTQPKSQTITSNKLTINKTNKTRVTKSNPWSWE